MEVEANPWLLDAAVDLLSDVDGAGARRKNVKPKLVQVIQGDESLSLLQIHDQQMYVSAFLTQNCMEELRRLGAPPLNTLANRWVMLERWHFSTVLQCSPYKSRASHITITFPLAIQVSKMTLVETSEDAHVMADQPADLNTHTEVEDQLQKLTYPGLVRRLSNRQFNLDFLPDARGEICLPNRYSALNPLIAAHCEMSSCQQTHLNALKTFDDVETGADAAVARFKANMPHSPVYHGMLREEAKESDSEVEQDSSLELGLDVEYHTQQEDSHPMTTPLESDPLGEVPATPPAREPANARKTPRISPQDQEMFLTRTCLMDLEWQWNNRESILSSPQRNTQAPPGHTPRSKSSNKAPTPSSLSTVAPTPEQPVRTNTQGQYLRWTSPNQQAHSTPSSRPTPPQIIPQDVPETTTELKRTRKRNIALAPASPASHQRRQHISPLEILAKQCVNDLKRRKRPLLVNAVGSLLLSET